MSERAYLIPIGVTVAEGQYQVMGTHGQGGMGDVYSVKYLTTGEMMAFKTLLPDQSRNEAIVQRFREEAETLLRIHASDLPGREYFPRAYSHGYDNEYRIHYMTMEPVNGPDLYKYYILRGGRLTIRESVVITVQLLKGLGVLHELGIVHRDIKPENILIVSTSTGPRAFVIDLGIVKNESSGRTMTRDMLGTPAYMAPEVWSGAKKAGRRSDIFAAGAILYELILGCPAFAGDSQANTMFNVCTHPNPEMPSWVPASLRGIVRKAIAKNPDERFGNTKEFIEELEKLTDTELDATISVAAHAASDDPTEMIATGDPGFRGAVPPPTTGLSPAAAPARSAATTRIRANTPLWNWRRNSVKLVAGAAIALVVGVAGGRVLLFSNKPSQPTPSATTRDAAPITLLSTPLIPRDVAAPTPEVVIPTPEAPTPDASAPVPDASAPDRPRAQNRRGQRDGGRIERPHHDSTPQCRRGYTLMSGRCCRAMGAGGRRCDD